MSEPGSVTVWLDRLKAGDRGEAVERLWAAYFARLVAMAGRRLRSKPRPAADEEDVALSAFDSVIRAAAAGRFPRLSDRDDLWHVLLTVTARKTSDLIAAEAAAKRGGGKVRVPVDDGADVAGTDPTPSEAAMMAEAVEQLLDCLGDDQLRRIAVWRLEGYTAAEIAAKVGRSVPTVERKLRMIREAWAAAGEAAAGEAG